VPPAPWPNPSPGFNFSALLTDAAVLQAAPAQAAVFGNVGTADASAAVTVTVALADGSGAYAVPATVAGGRWKALLRATPDTGAAHNVTATLACAGGACGGSVTIVDVIFGDVIFIFGQSNAWLQMQYTYGRNASFAKIAAGAYDNVRVASGDSQANGLAPSGPPLHRWRHARDAAALPRADVDALDQFSAMGWHFAEAMTEHTNQTVHFGLVSYAIGGSSLEEWVTNDVAQSCFGSNPDANDGGNHRLWDNLVVPSLDMTVKMFLYYVRPPRLRGPRAPRGATLPSQRPPPNRAPTAGGEQRGRAARQRGAARGLRVHDARSRARVPRSVFGNARHDRPARALWHRVSFNGGLGGRGGHWLLPLCAVGVVFCRAQRCAAQRLPRACLRPRRPVGRRVHAAAHDRAVPRVRRRERRL
jgi:hypothetical protein